MSSLRDNLRNNISYHLQKNGIKNKELAKELGVSSASVTNWITGKNSPDIELIAQMCEFFGVSITEMMLPNADEQNLSSVDKKRQQLIHNYDSMNETAQNTLVKYSEFMASQPENQKNNTNSNKMNA